jgi:hypothetical protein
VRQDRGVKALDGAGEDAAAFGAQAEFHAFGEEDLHADADAEDRAAGLDPARDHLLAADAPDARHAGGERADAGDDEAIALGGLVKVGGDRDIGADAGEGAFGGTQVPRPVVEDDDAPALHL